ncbi:Protein tipE [Eumeta japonica]|uniref:Protein tipE n=1 Tax=Eumeta variegata TaxID=151549 RepID=A0A4C1W3U2_EUMVA|nr:Protein tipE [Eumeta japonica]
MADDEKIPRTFLEKLLFYTTASFVLLATFSLFAFLFLVPFVIEPAFTTIFMQFDPVGALCVTVQVKHLVGIRVNYKLGNYTNMTEDEYGNLVRVERNIRANYEYEYDNQQQEKTYTDLDDEQNELPDALPTGLQGNDSEWYFTGARLFPNVKGCGYPPMLNCTVFLGKYRALGTNYTCYYSRVDPGLVITDLDMWQNTLNLIYNTDEESEQAPLQDDAEAMATGDEEKPTTPGSDTFRENLAGFGHQLKIALANEKSKDDFESNSPAISNSASLSGLRLGVTYEKGVTLGNVTMSHRTRERPAECLASLSHSTMIGLPRAQH